MGGRQTVLDLGGGGGVLCYHFSFSFIQGEMGSHWRVNPHSNPIKLK